jgi:PAS domain S-box-containing protein
MQTMASTQDKTAEIRSLIKTLHAVDQRLDELLGGEVDSVMDDNGRSIVLRRAQGHLRQSEQAKQSAMLAALPANIALLDARGVIVSVNAAWSYFGSANGLKLPGDAVGVNYLEVCDQAQGRGSSEAGAAAAGIRSILSGKASSFSLEYPCHAPAQQRWFVMRVAPLSEGVPSGVVVMHLDVTERRLADNALAALSQQTAQRERMFSTMLASINDFAFIYDRKGCFVFVNQPMLDLWGLHLEQVVGKNYHSLGGYPAEVAQWLQAQVQEVLQAKKTLSFETPSLRPPGAERYYEYVYSPVLASDGSVDFVVGTTRDITERRRSQHMLRELNADLEARVLARTRALARQEALFQTLADEAPAIIWTLDASASRITYLNAEGARLLGGSAQDWLGKKMLSIIHPGDLEHTLEEAMRALNARDTFESIRRLRSADGTFRTMSCRASPVLGEQGAVDFWVGHELDITALKETENALRSSNSELESFAYSLAHDLRSPLTIIDGFSRMLGKELGAGASQRAVHLMTRMRASVKQMDEVSSGMLALAGISRTAMQVQTADLSQIAQEVAELLMERDPERQVKLNIENALLAQCDAKMMRSLMSNLMGNAWKFTAKVDCAQISFTSSSVSDAPEAGAATVYCVRDNGAGFDMAYADKLSQPFQRLHESREFEGTGLGLATVRKIVERHGGWLRLEGEVGKGACVWFTLSPAGA